MDNPLMDRTRRDQRLDAQLKTVPIGQAIPHVIHMTHRGTMPPPTMVENLTAIRGINPDWEVRVYDDAAVLAYVTEHFGASVRDAWLSINPAYGAARADLFRYLLIYNEGGCYLDSKSSTTRSLSELLLPDDGFILTNKGENGPGERLAGWGIEGYEDDLPASRFPRGSYEQWFIISVAGHPFLREVVLSVLERIRTYDPARMGRARGEMRGVGRWGVLRLTGPIVYSLTIEPLRKLYPHRMLRGEEELGLVYSTLMAPGTRIGADQHYGLFGTHYSRLSTPIVQLSAWRNFKWWLVEQKWRLVEHLLALRAQLALRTRALRLSRSTRVALQTSSLASLFLAFGMTMPETPEDETRHTHESGSDGIEGKRGKD